MLIVDNIDVVIDDVSILTAVSFQSLASVVTGVVGLNGQGKTTLFKTIAGYMHYSKGSICLDSETADRKMFAFLSTEPFFYQSLTGREYLEALSYNNTHFDIDTWGGVFQLPLERTVERYSAGMKKKLAFIGILALERNVLLLDEPFNNLDIESNFLMTTILHKLRQQGKIILITSHIYEPLLSVCDVIHWLHNKTIQRSFNRNEFHELTKQLNLSQQENIKAIEALLPVTMTLSH
jgi:ABC-2 type transport system ATP-binding protein